MTSGDLTGTRDALHAVCEHVLAAALYAGTGHIGLRVVPGGFATPTFGPDSRVITLGPGQLTVTDRSGARSAPLTTLQSAATLAGIEPGAPASVYRSATRLTPDAALHVDADTAAAIFGWYAKVAEALTLFAPGCPQTLWPEHLDVAIHRDGCNFGGLAGDGTIAEPYVYVGPGSVPASDNFFTYPFGAARTWTETPTAERIRTFFAEGGRRATEMRVARA